MTHSTSSLSDISPRQAALAAGCALLFMCILAPIAYFSVIQNLIVQGDANQITIVPGMTNDREVIKKAVEGCDGVLTVLAP